MPIDHPGGTTLSADQAVREVVAATPIACQEINKFSTKVFKTRGGRMGSGMGVLLEALWAYYVDQGRPARVAGNEGWEIGWLPDNQYNDFACIQCDLPWDPLTKEGEFFRIEAKSMNSAAEESKGHFDQLHDNIGDRDLLLVLIWSWRPIDRGRVSPIITDHFIGPARSIAYFRDKLHLARGGSFVDRRKCADGCTPSKCLHHGEPLNASGKRERLSGPSKLRPSAKVSFAANFGGLIRMLKTSSPKARTVFQRLRATDDVVHDFVTFVHRNYPREEENTYRLLEWQKVAELLGLDTNGPTHELLARVRQQPNYADLLRKVDR